MPSFSPPFLDSLLNADLRISGFMKSWTKKKKNGYLNKYCYTAILSSIKGNSKSETVFFGCVLYNKSAQLTNTVLGWPIFMIYYN